MNCQAGPRSADLHTFNFIWVLTPQKELHATGKDLRATIPFSSSSYQSSLLRVGHFLLQLRRLKVYAKSS